MLVVGAHEAHLVTIKRRCTCGMHLTCSSKAEPGKSQV